MDSWGHAQEWGLVDKELKGAQPVWSKRESLSLYPIGKSIRENAAIFWKLDTANFIVGHWYEESIESVASLSELKPGVHFKGYRLLCLLDLFPYLCKRKKSPYNTFREAAHLEEHLDWWKSIAHPHYLEVTKVAETVLRCCCPSQPFRHQLSHIQWCSLWDDGPLQGPRSELAGRISHQF